MHDPMKGDRELSTPQSFIVYVASQYAMTESPTWAEAIAEAKIANAARVIAWPFPEAVYATDDHAKALRKARYGQAAQDAKGAFRDAVQYASKGLKCRVWVGSGIVLTGDVDRKVYANVVLPGLLAEIAANASEVHVSAGSEDPREYLPA